jgi:hypothetical protein
MAAAAILWPVAAHLALIALLYAWLTYERRTAVRRGQASMATFRLHDGEPLRSKLVSNNLSNQFELPLLFHVLAMTLYVVDGATTAQVALAWTFVAIRCVHTGVHVLSPNVGLRGAIFSLSFIALGAMWALFLAERLLGLRLD